MRSERARFWEKVSIRRPWECWMWTASTDRKGYGQFMLSRLGRSVGAHRWAYAQSVGTDVSELDVEIVRHICDMPGCVNPSHLLGGTAQDNTDDRGRRGRNRSPYGEDNGQAKLTDENVIEIRRRLAIGHKQSAIASDYGVERTAIGSIKRGITWNHVKEK